MTRISFAAALAGILALALAAFPARASETLDATPRIAVVSAFPPEWIELQKALTDRQEFTVNGGKFLTGRLAGKDVVLFLSGVSMVNAAMTTQAALDRFAITSIVFSGIAGGVDPNLHIGDVIIAGQWGQYLESIFARETGKDTFSIPPFFKPGEFAGYGMMVPNAVTLTRQDGVEPETRFWFPADPALLETAKGVASTLTLEACAEASKCLANPPKIVVGGNGVSGQAFVDNAAFREYVLKTFDAKVLDMESAAVAHVAYANSVPFLAVRSLSDLAGGGEGANEMGTFMALASSNSAAVVEAIVGAMK